MARLPRVCPIGIPQHVIQRGNNRQVCFACEQDFAAYAGWLKDCSKKYQVDIHAWVLMTNHVHLLCTPRADNAVSHMMQSLGRQYAERRGHAERRGLQKDGVCRKTGSAERRGQALQFTLEVSNVRPDPNVRKRDVMHQNTGDS